MNIFYLDTDPKVSAQMMHDKHVVKMILETAQLLSTAHRVLDGTPYIDSSSGRKIKRWSLSKVRLENSLYKATHINHPSAVWSRVNSGNYHWLYEHFVALCDEYTYRYGKVHATDTKLRDVLLMEPENIPSGGITQMPQAMPDKYKNSDSVTAYRSYYIGEKKQQSKYTKRNSPIWL